MLTAVRQPAPARRWTLGSPRGFNLREAWLSSPIIPSDLLSAGSTVASFVPDLVQLGPIGKETTLRRKPVPHQIESSFDRAPHRRGQLSAKCQPERSPVPTYRATLASNGGPSTDLNPPCPGRPRLERGFCQAPELVFQDLTTVKHGLSSPLAPGGPLPQPAPRRFPVGTGLRRPVYNSRPI